MCYWLGRPFAFRANGRLRSRDKMASREVAGQRREGTMSGVEDNGHDSGHGEVDAIDRYR
jgi:hypothetical protein